MTRWESYPKKYREMEVEQLISAVQCGECAAVIGLSGAGKSNLLGFLAHRCADRHPLVLVDCNRLASPDRNNFYRLISEALCLNPADGEEIRALENTLGERLQPEGARLCLLFDRFDALPAGLSAVIHGGLRALRDSHKYQLTLITATRHALPLDSELAELLDAHTLQLGPLNRADAAWSAQSTMERSGKQAAQKDIDRIIDLSWGYPALLRACCQAFSAGCALELEALSQHPVIVRRVKEFWSDSPTEEEIRNSGLDGQPLLEALRPSHFRKSDLTAKEALLFEALVSHPGEICEKDDLIRAVWPEDKVRIDGIRDDSLAQLVSRLRRKIEPDPENPCHITSIIGRGYRYTP